VREVTVARQPLISATLCVAALVLSSASTIRARQATLPAAIPDTEFWRLAEDLSEPDAPTVANYVLSSDVAIPVVARELAERVTPGGVYLGIGHEENYSYISAARPRIAFIANAGRGTLHLHLMYKALFELAADRAELISLLFTKPRPDGLTAASSASDLMNAYWNVATSPEVVYRKNLQAIQHLLTSTRQFSLTAQDLTGIEHAYFQFYWHGPSINGGSPGTALSARNPMFAELMTVRDAAGGERSYLSTEERFRVVKELHTRNLIVPLVGHLAGPKTLRAIGEFLRIRSAAVSAFYVSGVEATLSQRGLRASYCTNLASLPIDESSMFIRPVRIASAITVPAIRGTRRDSGGGLAVVGAPGIQVSTRPDSLSVTPIGDELKTCK
jgi:hypothetical protein